MFLHWVIWLSKTYSDCLTDIFQKTAPKELHYRDYNKFNVDDF